MQCLHGALDWWHSVSGATYAAPRWRLVHQRRIDELGVHRYASDGMFTGTVQTIGRMACRDSRGGNLRWFVDADGLDLSDTVIGDGVYKLSVAKPGRSGEIGCKEDSGRRFLGAIA